MKNDRTSSKIAPAKIAPAKISKATSDSYKWTGVHGESCDGWHLVRTPQLSVIEEAMPPGASEHRHHHLHARQFFYVLEGELSIEIEATHLHLYPGEGIEIAPGQAHQVMNRSPASVRFLVTSQPLSHGDRIDS
jgi:mannose-6-phosphate isomerase-like protein (cupin superfamily)